jgi:hypothetical protein
MLVFSLRLSARVTRSIFVSANAITSLEAIVRPGFSIEMSTIRVAADLSGGVEEGATSVRASAERPAIISLEAAANCIVPML